ncbi:hypothetical protein IFM89_019451 [Coptis chinensis]|uniref:DUF295 domain-containing protein n=1 Tax=Coptis chinensis TaxID=261450 RepID=A0A835HFR5_9MAGN|nr:hypothetical protein IFM89_019451 [Coptis chinensis]
MEPNYWSTLSEDVLENEILSKLCFADLYRFGGVCKPWKSLCGPLKFRNHLPWLIVPPPPSINSNKTMVYQDENVGFYSLCDGKVYKAKIPQLCNRRICASFLGGWLMTIHENSEVQLFNPLSTRPPLNLPPLDKFPGVQRKFKKQVCFEFPKLFYTGTRGNFYAVHASGPVVVIHGLDTIPYAERLISDHPERSNLAGLTYILESAGDLLVLFRSVVGHKGAEEANDEYPHWPHKTVGFKVLKLEFGSPNRWVELKTLGDRALFVGYNSSFSLLASTFSGCKPNHIYFTDNLWGYFQGQHFGGQDFGIFNLEDGSIQKFLYPPDAILVLPPPIWFAANPPSS